jgi:NADH-quinone oxidoreductase subunit C
MNLEPLRAIAVEVDETTVRVDVDNWQRAAEIARRQMHCEYFSYLSAIDWLPNPDLNGEKVFVLDAEPSGRQEIIVDPVIRKGGGSTRFQLIAYVYDIDAHEGVTLVTDLDSDTPAAPTWTTVYKGANWHERETWEMFGIDFSGHPGLRHLYLPEEFEGHPMRKDYPLLAREVRPWPGLVDMEEMPKVDPAEPPSSSTEASAGGGDSVPDSPSNGGDPQ